MKQESVTFSLQEELLPGLYIVSTPIGNLRDISLRALSTLNNADLIACEDTRVSAKLLRHYGISTKTTSYHDHNADEKRPELLRRLASGERIALISDAGTPLISDPGFKLVHEAVEAGIKVIPIPGASSILAALCLSGLPTDRFLFLGFLPAGEKGRKLLKDYINLQATLILFESPKRIASTLAVAAEILGARPAAVTRELTKLFEEAKHGTLPGLADYYAKAPEPKGEMVLVIAPGEKRESTPEELDSALSHALLRLPLKEAVAEVAASLQLPRNQVYTRALSLRGKE